MASKEKGNVKAALTYLFGFITGVIFLLIDKDKFVRFHAWQSIILFGGYFVLNVVLSFIPFFGYTISNLLWIVMVILWILLMVKAYQGEKYMLPYIGEIAAKQAK